MSVRMDGRENGTRTSFRTLVKITLVPVIGLAVFFTWNWLNGGETPDEAWREFRHETQGPSPAPPPASAPAMQASAVAVTPSAPPKAAQRPHGHGGEIVLIIDDLGFQGQPLDRVMALDPNVNCAILPNGTGVTAAAEALHKRGFEILCHLPMEPMGAAAPGRGAILTSMQDDEISRLTRENVDAVPYARGVNNHMGSRATADRRVMTSVLGALPDGMYFIDSRTAGNSLAGAVARQMNIRTASRQIFLDDVQNESAVRKQLNDLAAAAEKHGLAIGIGHPHAVTLRVLADELPELRARGFKLVRASSIVR
ncbi:MAG: uncharacterized protein QOH21_1412 [Acidobacteriota bacterium]|jgi:polysaccharide deacetylase 2 family uncharacterized protein YibQ|nr:uncharacterized protein [Acidobacteriota bacterium]